MTGVVGMIGNMCQAVSIHHVTKLINESSLTLVLNFNHRFALNQFYSLVQKYISNPAFINQKIWVDTFRTTDTGNNTDTYCNARANADHRTETTAWVNIYSCSYTNGSFSVAVVVPDLNVGPQTVDVSVGSVGYSGPVDNSFDGFADPTLEVISNSLKRQSVDDLASLDSNIDGR